MLLKIAKTIEIGDIVRVSGSTGRDEGKLGRVITVNEVGKYGNFVRMMSFELECLDGVWECVTKYNKNPKIRRIAHYRLELVKDN